MSPRADAQASEPPTICLAFSDSSLGNVYMYNKVAGKKGTTRILPFVHPCSVRENLASKIESKCRFSSTYDGFSSWQTHHKLKRL